MTTVIDNPIFDYYDVLRESISATAAKAEHQSSALFSPSSLPEMDSQIKAFFSASSVSYSRVELGLEIESIVLNMSRFERTRTTKTNPSLLMVARAVEHIRQSGEPVTIVTPSSGNKATALRAAVYRAYELELATPETLNIVCVVPSDAESKLWDSPLSTDDRLRALNPLVTIQASARDTVKRMVAGAAQRLSSQVSKRKLWFTLALDNYVLADQLRAFIEIDYFSPEVRRWHAHSVSSAFGLIGHSRGWAHRASDALLRPGYLLIQHLDTPDMVLHLASGTFDRAKLPEYKRTGVGTYQQSASLHFPRETSQPDECIDTTFYTSAPVTQSEMEGYIEQHGGSGIVVSRVECEHAYDEVRAGFSNTDIHMPEDVSRLREHSLLMAATGTRLAKRRGLLDGVGSLVIHNSGSYTADDFDPVRKQHLTQLNESQNEALDNIIERARERAQA